MIHDLQERQRALDPDTSFIVQAPAGSGKTELLTQRFLVLLSRVTQPEEIYALTFTKKAALEMRQRIIAALNKAQHEPAPSQPHALATWELAKKALARDAELNWNLLQNPNRLRTLTIDALCSSISSSMPILANFGASPSVCDHPDKYYQIATKQLLKNAIIESPWQAALHNLLQHLDNRQATLENLLIAMLSRRDQWLPFIMAARNKQDLKDHLEKTLEHITQSSLKKIEDTLPYGIVEELLALLRFARKNLAYDHVFNTVHDWESEPGFELDECDAWLAIAQLLLTQEGSLRKVVDVRLGFPAPSSVKGDEKLQFKLQKEKIIELLANLAEEPEFCESLDALRFCPPLHYTRQQWQVVEDLLLILPVLAAELRVVFNQYTVVDFIEISQAALTALGHAEDPSDLALRLDHQISHLLIDEFQDTSTTQIELIHLLTAGWQAQDGRTLFLVGDPMQSIYRFREAQVGLFLDCWQHGLGSIPLTALRLTSNFRSDKTIVEWFNAKFDRILPPEADMTSGAVNYASAHAVLNDHDNTHVCVYEVRDRQHEADAIAQDIKTIRHSQPDARIAILLRTRRHSAAILPALREANIAYQAIDIEQLATRPVIIDLWSLTRALLHPADNLAWLSILRAPWCGLSLADLHFVANAGGDTLQESVELALNLKNSLSDAGFKRLTRIAELIRDQLAVRLQCRLRDWIEQSWLLLGGPACYSTDDCLSDATQFFELLDKFSTGGTIENFDEFESQLNQLYARGDSTDENPVQVLTIHKSKGLEFDAVLLPAIDKSGSMGDTELLLWSEFTRENGQRDLLFAPIKSAQEKEDEIYCYLRQVDANQENFETGRLLYVAATRAKRQLYFYATVNYKEDGTQKPPSSRSLLGHLMPALDEGLMVHPAASIEQSATSLLHTARVTAAPTHAQYVRLAESWNAPTFALPQYTAVGHNPIDDALFQPSMNDAQRLGTFIHRLLALISAEGLSAWTDQRIQSNLPNWAKQLEQLGLTQTAIPDTLKTITTLLEHLNADERAHWILDPHHTNAKSEWALTSMQSGKCVNLVIDRCFIADGIFWIIDYKTTLAPEILDNFLKEQQAQHTPQLHQYANALAALSSLPIYCALYFPLQQHWHTWAYREISTGEPHVS